MKFLETKNQNLHAHKKDLEAGSTWDYKQDRMHVSASNMRLMLTSLYTLLNPDLLTLADF